MFLSGLLMLALLFGAKCLVEAGVNFRQIGPGVGDTRWLMVDGTDAATYYLDITALRLNGARVLYRYKALYPDQRFTIFEAATDCSQKRFYSPNHRADYDARGLQLNASLLHFDAAGAPVQPGTLEESLSQAACGLVGK